MKSTLLLVFLTCSTFFSYSQTAIFGFTGGAVISGVQGGKDYKNAEARKGLFAGLSYTKMIRPHFTFGADFLYMQRGFQNRTSFNSYGNIITFYGEYEFDYFAVPLKIGVFGGERVVFYANAGIVPSLLLQNTRPDIIDLGGLLEAGTGVYLSRNLLFTLSVTAQHSFTTFSNENYFKGDNLYHRSVSFGAGLKLAFGKKNGENVK